MMMMMMMIGVFVSQLMKHLTVEDVYSCPPPLTPNVAGNLAANFD